MTTFTPEGRALFLELVELSEAEQAERLDALRADAPALADEVAALLAADAEADGFLEPPAIDALGDDDEDPSGRWLVGRRIGRYTIEARIGIGGMGTVYVARQDRPKRKVALKLLRTSSATGNLRRRFEREAEILGRLRHPGIAEIYEAGTHDSELGPVPYFALEYIPEAKSITRYADEAKLGVHERVELLVQVCDAVAEAHRHGIVHRDIKPSNVLVGADGAPKLIDFGIARWIDDPDAAGTIATQLGDLLGTLHYMSPEQFDGSGPGPNAASDVYSLGVVAYELVAGRLPYPVSHSNAARISELVRTHVPEPLTRVKVGWRALDDVVQIALAQAPTDRYRDAAELAADLRRAVAGEPVRARRSQRIHRLRTLAWRSRRAVPWLAATGAAAAALAIAMRPADTRVPEAPVEGASVNDDAYGHHIAAAERALAANDLARAKVELGACAVEQRGWEWHRLLAQVDRSLQVVTLGSPVHTLQHDPTRGLLVATTEEGTVHALRAKAGTPVPELQPAWRVALAEELMATTIDPPRGLVYVGDATGLVHRLRLDDGSDAGSFGTRGSAVASMALWGRELLVSRRAGAIERWDPDALARISSVDVEHEPLVLTPAEDTVFAAWNSWGVDEVDPRNGVTVRTFPATEGVEAILVDGDVLYIAGWDDRITAFDRRARGEPRLFAVEPDGLLDIVELDDETLVTAGRDGAIAIWDTAAGKQRQRLRGHDFGVDALALGGDGRWLASASLDGTVRTWDVHAPPIDRVLVGVEEKVQGVAFAGDRVIAATGPQWGRLDNDAVRAWSVADGSVLATVTDHALTVDAIAVSGDGGTVVTGSRDGVVHVRATADLSVREVLQAHEGPVRVLAFVDDATFVSGGEDGSVAWWSTDGRELGQGDAGVGAIADAVGTAHGVVVGGKGGLAKLGPTTAAQPFGTFTNVTALARAPDETIVVGRDDGTLARIELGDATTRWSAPTFGRAITDVAVSPDGSRIATSSQDYRIRLYDADTGEFLLTVGVHESVATSVAFSPDGRTIASGGFDRVVRLWHAPTGSDVSSTGRR